MDGKQPKGLHGICSKGYGTVPKFVMHDRNLSLESRAIYAYFCSLAGKNKKTFPYRNTILRDLGISKNTYYKHYKPLLQEGYIQVQRPWDKSAANIYTLVQAPSKIPSRKKLDNYGYGTIPKIVMQNKHISIKAKGLYAYLCAYAGREGKAFPQKKDILFHLGISEPTYYKALAQLQDVGYVTTVQRRQGQKFSGNTYYLKNLYTGNKNTKTKQQTKSMNNVCFFGTKIWDTRLRDKVICDSISTTKLINNNFSNTSSDRTEKNENMILQSLYKRWQLQNGNGKDKYITDAAIKVIENLFNEKTQHRNPKTMVAYQWVASCCRTSNGIDRLWDTILSFSKNFRPKEDIRNYNAYLEVSLHNWLAEQMLQNSLPIRKRKEIQSSVASYNLQEVEQWLVEGIT